MIDSVAFAGISTTTLADILGRTRIMGVDIRPLWAGVPRIAGPAYPVRCPTGDHLMLHAAIYRAPRGSVIVVASGDRNFALAGGNVCAVAQRNGIAGFVLDGLVRDIGEIRASGFAVFGCGVIPIAGAKDAIGTLNQPITCGGVSVAAGDLVVADEDGVVVVPCADMAAVLEAAQARAGREADQSLLEWQADHQRRIAEALKRCGFEEPRG
jgi:4-hydroxy-4-methyl-2-oxoglutarate aldolase